MTASLSIIIPTVGRISLKDTLNSVVPQLVQGDEVLVVADGPVMMARAMAKELGASYLETPPTHSWGHAQRNYGMAAAKGKYLAFMDDDDVYLPGALDAMRRAIAEHEGRLFIFRMMYRLSLLWAEPRIAPGNVSTQMYVFPNIPSKLGVWKDNPDSWNGKGGDFLFAQETALHWGAEDIVFRKEVIAKLVRHSEGNWYH
jgi:glycosyltransferase involved in cell wall biosynthesis